LTAKRKLDRYDLLESLYNPPAYVGRLRQVGVFDDLDEEDASWMVGVIVGDIAARPPLETITALRQRAANAACGADPHTWHDRAAASTALGAAADVIAESSAEGSA
jgi:hypothetical protein